MNLTATAARRRVPAIAARAMLDPKLTQGALGQLLGVSTSLVARIELGERTPSPDLAERWARALGLPPEHVFPDIFRASVEPLAGGSIAAPTSMRATGADEA